jgi:hypothetical protein
MLRRVEALSGLSRGVRYLPDLGKATFRDKPAAISGAPRSAISVTAWLSETPARFVTRAQKAAIKPSGFSRTKKVSIIL